MNFFDRMGKAIELLNRNLISREDALDFLSNKDQQMSGINSVMRGDSNLKFTITPPTQEIVEHKFDIEVTYKKTCDCGAEKCRTTHTDWCSAR